MNIYSYYSLSTGRFSPRTFTGTLEAAQAHAPENHGVMAGGFDRATHRVEIASGNVIAHAEPLQIPDQVQAEFVRARRTQLLNATGWRVERAFELGQPLAAEWAAYRQALRDVPSQLGFPAQVDWPVAPD